MLNDHPTVTIRPVSTLSEPCILLEDLIEEEGLPAVIRAVARGLVLYDAGNAILVCRSRFDLMADSGALGEVV